MTANKPGYRLIQYVGAKPSKMDSVAGTDAFWSEPGAVVSIQEGIAAQLLKHPDIWRDITDDAEVEVSKTPPVTFAGDRADQIKAAIALMDQGSTEHFTKTSGKPRIEVIEGLLGYDISAKERDGGWDRLVQARLAESHGDAEGNVATPPIDAG